MKTDNSRDSKSPDSGETSLALRPPARRRKKLPREQIHGSAVSVVSVLTRSLPVCVFEPLGDVQAVAEEFRYAKQFLSKMSSTEDPIDRLCLLYGFIVSNYSGMIARRRKPFNPLLGETYDYISEDGWKYHGEKVSHHLSITTCHTEGLDWELFQAFQGKVSFALNSVSITSLLPVRLKLANGDEYSWNKNARAETHSRRILNEGEILIKTNTGIEGRLVFYDREDNKVTGEIFRIKDAAVLCRLSGSWDKGLDRISPNNKVSKIFEPIPLSEHAVKYYGFSDFAITLNEIRDHERGYLLATGNFNLIEFYACLDSRYRPDQRHLENAEPKLTEQAKKRLEQAQRKHADIPHQPLWFRKEFDKFTSDTVWKSTKQYWISKEAQFRDEYSQQMI